MYKQCNLYALAPQFLLTGLCAQASIYFYNTQFLLTGLCAQLLTNFYLAALQHIWEEKHTLQKYNLYMNALDHTLQKLGKYYSKFDKKSIYVLALGKFCLGSL